MKNKVILLSTVLVGTLAVAGCKKSGEQAAQTIALPEGQLYISTQWVEGQLWVQSFDPKTRTCLFAEYREGKPVEEKTVTFTNCRTGLGGSMMRPMMEQGMMRPGMPPRPGRVRPGMPQSPTGQPPAPVAPPAQG